eukprot:2954427-Rhodomonas_salina.3
MSGWWERDDAMVCGWDDAVAGRCGVERRRERGEWRGGGRGETGRERNKGGRGREEGWYRAPALRPARAQLRPLRRRRSKQSEAT